MPIEGIEFTIDVNVTYADGAKKIALIGGDGTLHCTGWTPPQVCEFLAATVEAILTTGREAPKQ